MSEQTRILTPEEADRCANSHTLFLSTRSELKRKAKREVAAASRRRNRR